MNKYKMIMVGVALAVMTGLVVLPTRVMADWLIDRSGTLVEVDGYVLGDEAENEDEQEVEVREQDQENERERARVNRVEGEDGGNTGDRMEYQTEQQKKLMEAKREEAKNTLEKQVESRIKSQEIRREKTKSKLEVVDGKLKVRQETENENGKVVRSSDKELPDRDRLRIEREDGKMLEINAVEGDKIEIGDEKFKAHTSLPISVGENNELIVTKKDGTQKVVAVLPDQAVANLEARGLVSGDTSPELSTEGDDTVYKFEAQEEKRILGLFKYSFKKQAKVSAETGEVVETTTTETSPLLRLLERLSF